MEASELMLDQMRIKLLCDVPMPKQEKPKEKKLLIPMIVSMIEESIIWEFKKTIYHERKNIFKIIEKNIILSLTVKEVKNGSHPSKIKGLGPFIFYVKIVMYLNLRKFLCGT